MKLSQSRRNRKKKQPITIMLVPGSTDRARKVTFTSRAIKLMVSAVAVVILMVVLSTWMAVSDRVAIRRVNEIKQENRDKEKTIQELKEQMEEIHTQQESLTKRQMQIQKMMGIEGEPKINPDRGMIRESAHEEVSKEVNWLKVDISNKNKELDNYSDIVKKDQKYYRARPNQWPVSGEISSEYGWRESPFKSRRKTFHDGIDIANQVGSPILAAGDGTVTFAGWKPVYGKTIEIDHGYGIVTMYGHNSQLMVKSGEKVRKGQQIAMMGTTGRSTGPHLHFSVIKAGATQDPQIYLP